MFKMKLNNPIKIGNKLIRKGSIIYLYSGKQKAKRILTEDELKHIESLDPSNNFKYTDWIALQYKENGISLEDLEKTVEHLNEVITKKEIDFNFERFTYNDVLNFLSRKHESKEDIYLKGLSLNVDFEFIDKNNIYYVFSPKTKKATDNFGENTQWFLGIKNKHINYFNFYNNLGIKFYCFLPRKEGVRYLISIDSLGNIKGQDESNIPIDYKRVLKLTKFSTKMIKPLEKEMYSIFLNKT